MSLYTNTTVVNYTFLIQSENERIVKQPKISANIEFTSKKTKKIYPILSEVLVKKLKKSLTMPHLISEKLKIKLNKLLKELKKMKQENDRNIIITRHLSYN